MTAVDFEMKPSWYKDPAWIFRDATLFSGFLAAVKILPAEVLYRGSPWVWTPRLQPLKKRVQYNEKFSYMNVLKNQPTNMDLDRPWFSSSFQKL